RQAANFLSAERERKDKEAATAAARTNNKPAPGADDGDGAGDTELSEEDNTALEGEDPPAPGEDDGNGDPEADALPPIARPKSWGKEDQADWEALPRSQQEKIAAREETREKAIRKAQNDAAESSRAAEAKGKASDVARTEFETKARTALDILAREQQRDFGD